jgi:hypothetical protein
VVERLRALLEHPLDPPVARAAVALAGAVLLGFAALVALGLAGGHRSSAPGPARSAPVDSQGGAPVGPSPSPSTRLTPDPAPANAHQQDPQDRPGTAAHARAERELAGHRALQHLPYRRAGLKIELVGAKGRRAVLAVSAPTLAGGRRGYREFLRRCRDDGRSYLPRFRVKGGRRG